MERALILVDIQNDFMPGGALAVPNGDEIVSIVNEIQKDFNIVLATKDWHPSNHISFASQHPGAKPGDFITVNDKLQCLWTDHCVQKSHGAEFHDSLITDSVHITFLKGTDPKADSYSGFCDDNGKETGLDCLLKTMNVDKVFIVGLATDYCVKYTALDSCKFGYETFVILEGCRGVNLQPDDISKALDELKNNGVHLI